MGMGMGMSMFESPRTSGANASGLASLAQAGLQSPNFGGSQQSVGGLGINDVFADLVDHDAAGLDATSDAKDRDVDSHVHPSTEGNGDFAAAAAANMDPQLVAKAEDDAPMLDAPCVAVTTEAPANGPHVDGAHNDESSVAEPEGVDVGGTQIEDAKDVKIE